MKKNLVKFDCFPFGDFDIFPVGDNQTLLVANTYSMWIVEARNNYAHVTTIGCITAVHLTFGGIFTFVCDKNGVVTIKANSTRLQGTMWSSGRNREQRLTFVIHDVNATFSPTTNENSTDIAVCSYEPWF